ncbi:glycoprotein-N-acetylgalactosamine 3-beta-galactosyltransferase 1-like isoform X3 [Ostrea edulis]|uniref:glycoprotein-N-acetylgalactosamine 3-beta-galactosyltransferase 1-like isoform X3 n=1 Tax=Ostrea edulis TaxID=37623 RepID=UPI002095E502|nr:glycoprotein-N-acetylgalactosamine 3-beta-galactosyltransferase 1-like isoform X3 [Ostrea edulis]XP_048755939.1 glycoprotein-N-acetylgalactosamine 3-beta-galactosyltransferase 1-like isoform X3 [Ostrea edulis]XP_056007825.1 glycoprotein-N-acetylgalactosamine 3-beta-galactosyltransferase 1-like isoform X3 [Ostrea edulis]XP_056007826.1 glycoprotein-N-acetylgalactosamine 3-beta-galactosyltransferase 1-like isoform X3 [Ostrea edulis]XP_056007827.1 glycoprotein-N-acetylgalactosamine 3-beta-galact
MKRNCLALGCCHTSHLNFCFGLSVGLVISFLLASFSSLQTPLILTRKYAAEKFDSYLSSRSLQEVAKTYDEMHEDMDKRVSEKDVKEISFDDEHEHHDDDTVARKLAERIRVLCWIMTGPQNLQKKAIHVKKTWGKRCTKLIFFSSETNHTFPTIGLNISEGRDHLTGKTMRAFKYVYDHFFDEADWFMKADDDTYFIMENLRYFLSSRDQTEPVYFGHHFRTIVKQGYYSGGAGYILSKETLKRLATTGQNPKFCRQDGGAEDAELGKCMQNLGVKTANSTDALGRSRFHCFDPETHLMGGYPNWYYKYDANGARKGVESISDYSISFHYIKPEGMYSLEFYVYHLRPYGIETGNQDLNQHVTLYKKNATK